MPATAREVSAQSITREAVKRRSTTNTGRASRTSGPVDYNVGKSPIQTSRGSVLSPTQASRRSLQQGGRNSMQLFGKDGAASTPGDDNVVVQSKVPEKRTSFFRQEQEKRISIAEQLPQYPQMSLREALAKIAPRAGSILKQNKVLSPKREQEQSNSGDFDGVLNSESQPLRPPGVTPSTAKPMQTSKQLPQYNLRNLTGNKSSATSTKPILTASANASALIHVSVPMWGMDYTVQVNMLRNTVRALRSWLQRFSSSLRSLDPKGKVLLDELQAHDFDELEANCLRGFSALVKLQDDTRALEAGRGWLTPEQEEQPAPEESEASSMSRGSVSRGSVRRSFRGSVQGGLRDSVRHGDEHPQSRNSVVDKSGAHMATAEERQLQREIQKLQSKIDQMQKRIKAADRKRLSAEMQLKVLMGTKHFSRETQTDLGGNDASRLDAPQQSQVLDQPKDDACWEEVAAWQDQMLDILQQRMKELEPPDAATSVTPMGGMATTVTLDGKTATLSPL